MTERDEMVALAEYHERRCDKHVYGFCSTARCMKRGGFVKGGDMNAATCEEHETANALRSAARTDAGNDAWLREQATALWAKLCTDRVHSRTEKCDCLDDILAAFSEIAALPAPGGASTGWQEITEENQPPLDTPLLLGWLREWPERKWEVEAGLYGSSKGGWNHGQATHWMDQPPAPTITRKSQSEERI